MFLFFLQGRAPFAAKAHFVQPVSRGESGNEGCKRNQGHCPRFFSEKRPDDGENVGGQFQVAAMNAMNTAAASAQTGKKLINGARSPYFRIIEAYTSDRVRVASCKANFPALKNNFRSVRYISSAMKSVRRRWISTWLCSQMP